MNGGSFIKLEDIIPILSIALGSSVLTTVFNHLATTHKDKQNEKRELIAEAQQTVLQRVELCYRIRRRDENDPDDIKKIRDLIHDNQEKSQYYEKLLLIESKWYGNRFSLYLKAIKTITARPMSEAWNKKGVPSAIMEDDIKLDYEKINELSSQFSLDSRRFMCPLVRAWMRIHDKMWRVNKYNV